MAANPSSRLAKSIPGTVLLSFVFAFPVLSFATQSRITLKGQVRTTSGGVIRMGVMAYLKAVDETPVASLPVDSDGNFEFDDVAPAIYTLIVTADQYQPYQQTLDLSSFVKYYAVNVVLTPRANHEVNPADLPLLTDEAAPKPARKEFSRGGRAINEKKYDEARTHLEKAVTAFPCYARAEVALAQVDLAQNRPADAESSLKKAIQCDGGLTNSYVQLAQLYYGQKKYQESEAVVLQGLRVSPSSWFLRFQLGTARFAQGKFRESTKDFEEAESLHPDLPADFHVQLVNAYLKIGQNSKALAEIDAYLRLDPNGKYAESGRKISEILRNEGVTEAPPPAGEPLTSKP